MKLRRCARAGRFVFVCHATDRLSETIIVYRRPAAAWPVRGIVAKHRIITGIGSAIDFRRLFGARAFGGAETSLLRRRGPHEKERGEYDQ
jgi:hypothetical protein